MKRIISLITILFIIVSNQATAAVNGKFVVLNQSETNFSISLKINNDTGLDDMGTSTIVFEFNNSALDFPASPVAGVDYEFQNFSGNNYSTATVTRPLENQIRVNIELMLDNMGTVVALAPDNWTDVVTLNFSVSDTAGYAGLKWMTDDIEIFDGDNFTMWEIGNFADQFNTPVPVELTNFAAAVADNSVLLNWESTTEINNMGYEIERKVESNREWKKIGFVDGKGTSSETNRYSFNDNNPVGGTIFEYRLKQIDYDGSFKYFDPVEVHFTPSEYSLLQNYPNPFNPSTTIRFSVVKRENVSLKVYNAIGQEVMLLLNKEFDPGFHEIDFNAKGLASGIYFYQLEAGNFKDVKKMLLLK